ncbi:MAG: hypothetical protein M5U26_07255 [Planctomycetota bacterium]|nr:hypothetical protein [Planctomycetota bacterium]
MFRYAGTIFLSAFLLFQVQPMIAKFILPWFGGGPAIWTTCLLFFQVALLLGYAYAHGLSARLAPRNQALVHLVLLGLAILWLPIVPNEAWKPHGAEPPTWRILALLGATIGMPYFVLSSTAPLLQRWFSLALPGRSPYRLYALSNAGSLLALGSYPFLVEPHLNLRAQALAWSAGFGLYVAGGLWCAWQIQKLDPRDAAAALAAAPEEEGPRPEPGRPDLLLWIGLAAFPSLLLLAVTNQMTQEVTPVPFLWVLPLALYLLSFIVCFDHPKWYRREVWGALFAALIGLTGYAVYKGVHLEFRYQVAIYAGVVFAAAMCCHGELVRARPRADQLTIYYLAIAAGGRWAGFSSRWSRRGFSTPSSNSRWGSSAARSSPDWPCCATVKTGPAGTPSSGPRRSWPSAPRWAPPSTTALRRTLRWWTAGAISTGSCACSRSPTTTARTSRSNMAASGTASSIWMPSTAARRRLITSQTAASDWRCASTRAARGSPGRLPSRSA